jgi:hypothetical protein
MSGALLNEHETMLNVGLGAEVLAAFTAAFWRVTERPEETVTMWHIATVFPLVFHGASRRAISKRRSRSGLRSILSRDPDNDIAQNEAIFSLNQRMRAMHPRTMRSLNCAIAWGLLGIEDGAIRALSASRNGSSAGEAGEIIDAARKLGTWAGKLTSFEYLTVLGVEFRR